MNDLHDIFQKYAALVIFDTETTGLDARTDRIIELAALRIEQTDRGTLKMAHSADLFVQLPDGQKIPEKIVSLTGITDAMLEKDGVDEYTAAHIFRCMLGDAKGPVLLAAHNAQFDLHFAREMFRRETGNGLELLEKADYLDTLTVYKDRAAYPHKLSDAIYHYKLQDKVQNTHRAIDDVAALFEVIKAMEAERADLLSYVNLFGYNPKYGVSGNRIDGVKYWPQNFNPYMQAPRYTLPARAKRDE